jgi:hypothetical protein
VHISAALINNQLKKELTMTNILIEMSEEEFHAQYPLMTNHLDTNASWACGDTAGCLFETCGPELAFVQQQLAWKHGPPSRISGSPTCGIRDCTLGPAPEIGAP